MDKNHASVIEEMRALALSNPAVQEGIEQSAAAQGLTVEEYYDYMLHSDEGKETMRKVTNTPAGGMLERTYFDDLRVMVPPVHADEPEVVERVFRIAQTGEFEPSWAGKSSTQEACSDIRQRWVPNYLLLDEHW